MRTIVVGWVAWLGAWSMAYAEEGRQDDAFEAYERASALFDDEQFAPAAAEFEQAYRLSPNPVVLYNIATSHDLAGHPEIAAQSYRAFVEADAGSEQWQKKARGRLAELSLQLAWLVITEVPDGCEVTVDDEERGTTPLTLALSPGAHDVAVRLDQGWVNRRVRVTAGEEQAESFVFPESESASLSAPGPVEESEPDPTARPWYKRWWVWTIVGAAAAVVGLGLGLGLGLREGENSDVCTASIGAACDHHIAFGE